MKLPTSDINTFYELFSGYVQDVDDAWHNLAIENEDNSPSKVLVAMSQLTDIMQSVHLGEADSDIDITTLYEYGQQLLSDLARMAEESKQETLAQDIDNLSLPLAIWMVQQGEEIKNLPPVVNALAALANKLKGPDEMAQLYDITHRIVEAVSPTVIENDDPTDPMRPWRVLLLNRAIVATRSHQEKLMEPAFDSIVEMLPVDAAGFFEQGMKQMDVVGYPDNVREVMNRYYLMHSVSHTLH